LSHFFPPPSLPFAPQCFCPLRGDCLSPILCKCQASASVPLHTPHDKIVGLQAGHTPPQRLLCSTLGSLPRDAHSRVAPPSLTLSVPSLAPRCDTPPPHTNPQVFISPHTSAMAPAGPHHQPRPVAPHAPSSFQAPYGPRIFRSAPTGYCFVRGHVLSFSLFYRCPAPVPVSVLVYCCNIIAEQLFPPVSPVSFY